MNLVPQHKTSRPKRTYSKRKNVYSNINRKKYHNAKTLTSRVKHTLQNIHYKRKSVITQHINLANIKTFTTQNTNYKNVNLLSIKH